MKRHKISNFIMLFSFLGFALTGCDENMPVSKEIGVENITLSEELVGGITLEKGTSANVSRKVTLTPEDATDRAENYSSSDPNVATISPKGDITANEVGTCNISITVGGKSVEFPVTVTPIAIIPIEDIILAVTSPLEVKYGETYDLSEQVGVEPINSNDELIYSSSDPDIVSVSSAGMLTSMDFGTVTITIAAKSDPSIKAELTVKVSKLEYSRENWTMTVSHILPITGNNAEGNSLSAAIDGNFGTNLCMVRPGKAYGTAPNRASVAIGEAIYFTIDMKEAKEVSYFRLRHRDTSQLFLRFNAFDQILGSNDGESFEVIATDVVVPDVTVSNIESPDISIPNSTYRYIKFYAKEAKCFNQGSYTSQGSTVQIQEVYLGLD